MPSTNDDYFYGWDLLYKTIEKQINKSDDLLLALVHFILTKHSKFRCIGLGDDKSLSDDDHVNGSELLPENWNLDENNYSLRYMYNRQLYVVLGLRTEGSLIVTLLDAKSRKVSNLCFATNELIKQICGSIFEIMPTASQLVDRIRRELLDPVFSGTSKSTTTQTSTQMVANDPGDPLRIGPTIRPPVGQYLPIGAEPARPFAFPEIGRGDLDPLARGGGGNLFPFPSHPDFRLGPGAGGGGGSLQPRFDPYGPPERSIRPNPNPDHLQPPNFGGDYYM